MSKLRTVVSRVLLRQHDISSFGEGLLRSRLVNMYICMYVSVAKRKACFRQKRQGWISLSFLCNCFVFGLVL